MVKINLEVTKELVRMLDRLQEAICYGCTGGDHEERCPAYGSVQLRTYLTIRINNPTRDLPFNCVSNQQHRIKTLPTSGL